MSTKGDVLFLVNPKSGSGFSLDRIRKALLAHWDTPQHDLFIQFSCSKEDGQKKTKRAVKSGVQTVLIAGGDGMVNSIGSELIGTGVALGVIPGGSGNGFARHFNIPLDASSAVAALARAERIPIDVGYADDRPFFVTCSLAWDAALVDAFEKFPVRGVLPYIFAGVYKFFEYTPQPFRIEIEGDPPFEIEDPMLCTIANLNQYGGGALIAPGAQADDGRLQLVTLRQHDLPWVLPMIGKLFEGKIDHLSEFKIRSFERLTVRRAEPGPMQLDGELYSAPAEVRIHVRSRALTILAPSSGDA